MQLLKSDSLSASWKFELMPSETPLAVQFLTLQNIHVRKPESLLVVGTALHYGEDYPCTGRLLLFRLQQQDAKAGSTIGDWAAQTAYIRSLTLPCFLCTGKIQHPELGLYHSRQS